MWLVCKRKKKVVKFAHNVERYRGGGGGPSKTAGRTKTTDKTDANVTHMDAKPATIPELMGSGDSKPPDLAV